MGEILLVACVDCPSSGVSYAFQNHNPAQPSVKKIVGVEADMQEGDQRIVAASEDE